MSKNNVRKGQAALEFVMTYGWALLILSVAVVVAWQLGLFSLTGSIEPGNIGFWGLVPSDFRFTEAGTLSMSLKNDIGANVSVTSVTATSGSMTGTVTSPALPAVVEPGSTLVFVVSGLPNGRAGSRFDILLSIDYTDSRTSTTHRSSGQIWGSYEV